jgi:hypothetical protein
MTHTPQPTQPSLILGLHYFCDHRCWRCPVSARCAVFARWSAATRARKLQFSSPGGRVASVLAVSLEVTIEEAAVLTADASGCRRGNRAGQPGPSDANPRPDYSAAEAGRDPLVARAGEYAQASWTVLQALRPIASARGDAAAVDAVERLQETCATVASKTFRAVSGALDGDADSSDPQSDSSGSAKVALLLIDESRQAWRTLMRPGNALADGLPARFVAMLDGIEAGLLRRFPRALDFVRPGFDTGAAGGGRNQLARAVLGATGTNGAA